MLRELLEGLLVTRLGKWAVYYLDITTWLFELRTLIIKQPRSRLSHFYTFEHCLRTARDR